MPCGGSAYVRHEVCEGCVVGVASEVCVEGVVDDLQVCGGVLGFVQVCGAVVRLEDDQGGGVPMWGCRRCQLDSSGKIIVVKIRKFRTREKNVVTQDLNLVFSIITERH